MKGLLIIFGIPIIIVMGIIGGAGKISDFMEAKAEQLQGAEKEDMILKNIKFMYAVGKYDRALKLAQKYIEQYDEYDEYDEGSREFKNIDYAMYIRGRTYDRLMKSFQAKANYKTYLERFPNGKYVEDVQERIRELGF